ncbi:hypothetical protein P278_19370 [Zhouia amylolytica AD3]|uniref:Uncharacterized protein n=1 Tax=Zhouia amylolytica AD3 TaxID=1286632 RepID=W2UPA6_9FLAO|nr:hypothetical protein P278_19370 [Zhouia amylolytica AD3]
MQVIKGSALGLILILYLIYTKKIWLPYEISAYYHHRSSPE